MPLRQEFSEDLSITDPEKRLRLYGQSDHVRNYNLETFCSRLNAVGFNTDLVSRPLSHSAMLGDAKLIVDAPSNQDKLNETFVLARKLN